MSTGLRSFTLSCTLSQLPILSYILDLPTKRNHVPSVKCQLKQPLDSEHTFHRFKSQPPEQCPPPPPHTHPNNSLTLSFSPHHAHHLVSSDFTFLLGQPRFPGFHFNYFLENALNFLPIMLSFILSCTYQPSLLSFVGPSLPPCLPIHPFRSS